MLAVLISGFSWPIETMPPWIGDRHAGPEHLGHLQCAASYSDGCVFPAGSGRMDLVVGAVRSLPDPALVLRMFAKK